MPDVQIGDNSKNAPTLADILAQEAAELVERAIALIAAAEKGVNSVEKITDAEMAEKITKMGRLLSASFSAMDADRLSRTKPFRDQESAINAWFAKFLGPLDAAKKKAAALTKEWGAKLAADAKAAQAKLAEQARLDKIAADQAAALAALSDDPADAVEAEQQQAAAASKAVEAAAPVHIAVKTDGASASFVTRKTGKVTDLKAFLAFLAEHYTASAAEWAQGQANYLARSTVTLPEGCGMERVETKEARFGS